MKLRPMLRNENINYSYGWFFVTIQAAFNKTIFGAIVGEECVLNELGQAVAEVIGNLGKYYAGTYVDCFVVMPNHIHLILKLENCEGNRKHQLGYVIGRFKSYVAKLYRDRKATGKAVDVGDSPWQRDYWEKIVTDHDQLVAIRKYIEENPKKWSRDRFGLVTSYSYGNMGLLNERLVGFVASQGAYREELKPRRLWVKEAGAEARQPENGEARQPENGEARQPEKTKLISERRATEPAAPVISTFTSAQERVVFEKVMRDRRRFVRVYPGGLPAEGEIEPSVKAACDEGLGLLLSPVVSGSGLNKQRAVWSNEYILKNAAEVWAGAITPGHTLASLVSALAPRAAKSCGGRPPACESWEK